MSLFLARQWPIVHWRGGGVLFVRFLTTSCDVNFLGDRDVAVSDCDVLHEVLASLLIESEFLFLR